MITISPARKLSRCPAPEFEGSKELFALLSFKRDPERFTEIVGQAFYGLLELCGELRLGSLRLSGKDLRHGASVYARR
jgi:hypothetical protein